MIRESGLTITFKKYNQCEDNVVFKYIKKDKKMSLETGNEWYVTRKAVSVS